MNGLNGKLCDSTGHSTASKIKILFVLFCFVCLLYLVFAFLFNFVVFGERFQWHLAEGGICGIGMHDMESTRNQ